MTPDLADPANITAWLNTIDADDEAAKTRRNAPTALRDSALYYARAGVPIFPLVPGEKRPASSHGLNDATTDPTRIELWWSRWPQANIGLRTGLWCDIIDVDGPQGYRSLDQLRQDGLIPDLLGRTHTARGGTHLYIRPTGDGNTAGLRPGVDYRGAGGYVVAPPSRSTDTGRSWTWVDVPDLAALVAAA